MSRNTWLEGLVRHRWLDPIQPTSLIELARGSERGAGDLLGVKTERTDKRTVLISRQSSGDGFGGEVVAEAWLVL